MPKFVPITDSERPKSEQSFYSDEFMQHRLFENPDAVIRSTEESLLNEKDEVAQHIRHAEGENKMVKNEKGLWVRAKTVDGDSKAHSGKGMGRGNRGISILDKYAEDQRRESEAHQIPSSSQFEDIDERSNKKERRSPSTEKRSERDRRSRDDSRESRRNAKRSRSRSHSPRQKRDRSRDRDRDRDRSPKHKKKRDRRDSRSRSRSRERRHKDRKRSRSPEYRRKDKYDSDRERESDREDRSSRNKSRYDDDRDRRRDKHQHESRRKYSSDEEEEEDKYKHRKNDAHKESHRKNNNKDRKEDQQDDDRDMVKISSHSTANHPPQRETSPPRRDDTKPLQETKQQEEGNDDDDLPPIQITAVQILNHFHEVFAMKSNRRLDSLLELFHADAKIQNLKTRNIYLSSLSAIKEAFQRTNPHEIIVSKRIYFEHSSFIHERNQELITYACDLHRAGTSPGLGDLSKDTILFYECCNKQILSIWGMNDVEQFAQNESLTEDQIYFSKLWPYLERILQEKWGKLMEMKKIDLMEISHFHNYDKMEVWG